MTTVAARATSVVSVWVRLDDHTPTPHTHTHAHTHARARDILGSHRHTVPPVSRRVRVVPVRRQRVNDLLLRLDVCHRHGLRVPVLDGLHVRPAVRPAVRVAIATRWDGDCGGGWVLHL